MDEVKRVKAILQAMKDDYRKDQQSLAARWRGISELEKYANELEKKLRDVAV